jgi:hypothetical protein
MPYLGFSSLSSALTTLCYLQMLLAIADAERQFDSITPIGSPSKQYSSLTKQTHQTQVQGHLLSNLLAQNTGAVSAGTQQALLKTHNWQIALRMNFLSQAHKQLLLVYGGSTEGNNSNLKGLGTPKFRSLTPSPASRPSNRKCSGHGTQANAQTDTLATEVSSRVSSNKFATLCTPGYIDLFTFEDSLPTTQVEAYENMLCRFVLSRSV